MQIVRLHDPARRPASWSDIITPGQFAVFAKDLDRNVPCDMDGARFADPGAAACAIFDSLDEARTFCEAAVRQRTSVQFDVFDAEGRARSPLLTIVHPARAGRMETSPSQARRRRLIAWLLIGSAVPMIAFAYVEARDRDIILIAFVGINFVLFGARLLWMNFALRETERIRENRVARAGGGKQAR